MRNSPANRKNNTNVQHAMDTMERLFLRRESDPEPGNVIQLREEIAAARTDDLIYNFEVLEKVATKRQLDFAAPN